MKNRLWFDSWTEEYMEGLPIGNGRLAAMVLGKPDRLRIALNHEWLWRGENRFRDYPDVSAHLPEIREALLSGDFLRGTELANRYLGGTGGISGQPNREDPYQPAGDIWIEFNAGEVTGYSRSLDLDSGLSCVEFDTPQGHVCQRTFAGSIDGCIVFEMTAAAPIDFRVRLSRTPDPRCALNHTQFTNGVRMDGAFTDGIRFSVAIAAGETDGKMALCGDHIDLSGATRLLLYCNIGTDAKGTSPEEELIFPISGSFDELFRKHAERFARLKGLASLHVDVPDSDLPTDQRIADFRAGGDPAMPLLYFEYGRYLMASDSSGELPLNLQGKWNEELQPPWESDYHLDINLQMCYWFTETLGMHHANDTLFNLIERYVPHGREMARKLYGCDGLTLCLQTDVWGRVTPESYGWAVWVGAAPWIAQHFFMHWRYTRDEVFLKDRCYPFLRDAAIFFEDYLIEKDGSLCIVPSQSPENRFEGTGDWPVSLGYDSAMDIEMITELLTNAAECADILQTDADRAAKWRNMVSRLPKLTVDSRGRLSEWDRERAEVEPGHRHLSHLYALYPGQAFEPGSSEWIAAEKSLDSRLSYGGGHTGWSRSWVACLMARLGRSADAWSHFMALIGDFATISLLDLHPPRIFQIDGNMGGTACVCEMLMQSRRGKLLLLPALPGAWRSGSVRNFRAQDTLNVDFSWNDGRLTGFTLVSDIEQTLTVCSDERSWLVHLHPGVPYTL